MYFCYIYLFVAQIVPDENLAKEWVSENPGERWYEFEPIPLRSAKNEKENSLTDARNVESLGNKALLEKSINIRASDYRFTDKKKYYEGFTNSKGQIKEGTGVVELLDLTATSADFTEKDIIYRYKKMIDCFINYLQKNSLIK